MNVFCLNKDPEELHKMRVEIKKLKAFTTFAKRLTKEDLAKHIEPVIKTFKLAGQVRTAQLNLQMIKKYRVKDTAFRKEQQTIFKTASAEFIASAEENNNKIYKSCNKLHHYCHEIGTKKILNFYKKEISSLSSFFKKDFDEAKLHGCRKKIKLLLYAESLLKKSTREKLRLNSTYLDELQNAIGEWHDTVILIDLFASRDLTDKETLKRLAKKREALLWKVRAQAEKFDGNITMEKAGSLQC